MQGRYIYFRASVLTAFFPSLPPKSNHHSSLPDNMAVFTATRPEWLISVASLILWGVFKLYRKGHRPSDLPPGPPTIPVFGNWFMLPQTHSFLQMTSWAREYGEIFSLMAGPSGPMIVLTSPRAIYEILERQGLMTSNRHQTVVGNFVTKGMTIVTSNYNSFWKASRRVTSKTLSPQACAGHLPLQMAESSQLMYEILRAPEETFQHMQRLSTSLILSTMYGRRSAQRSSPLNTKFIDLFRRNAALQSLSTAKLTQLFPILRHLPERLASWKRRGKVVRGDIQNTLSELVKEVEERLSRGEAAGCQMEVALKIAEGVNLSHEQTCYLGWSMMAAGSTTTSTWLHFFLLCIVTHPHVQAKAQEEIDKIVGSERIPQLEDLNSMPYVQALIKEVSRFRPQLPTGFPHVSTADLKFGDYRIPSGSIIMGNIWGIFRDDKLFKDPDSFDPERFLASPFGLREGVTVDDEDAFKRLNVLPWGSGRRACPGIYLSQHSIAINVMSLLWAFSFTKARNPEDGTEIDVDLWGFNCETFTDVYPFVVNATARSSSAPGIIRKNFLAHSSTLERFEKELAQEERRYILELRREASECH